jgi:hypothetical protein
MSSIIKVGKVQSSTGNDAVTVADSGAITANGVLTATGALTASGGIANAGTITAGTIGTSVTGFGLIRNAQEFRLQGEFDGSNDTNTVLGSGFGGASGDAWAENNTDYSRHGVSIWSQSSGVFSCSVTGIFLCTWCVSVADGTAGDKFDPNVQINTGSGYSIRAKVWGHVTGTDPTAMPVGNTFMFKVADKDNFNLRVHQSSLNNISNGTHIQGATDVSYSNIVFLRLGDV